MVLIRAMNNGFSEASVWDDHPTYVRHEWIHPTCPTNMTRDRTDLVGGFHGG